MSSSGRGGATERNGWLRWVRRVDARVRIVELAVLAAPAVALLLVYAAPESTRRAATFSHVAPSPVTAVTAHYVHVSGGHLATNLLVYLAVVPLAYVFSAMANRRPMFWVMFGTFLVVLPVVLSASSLLVFDRGRLLGFSAVALAFVGFLPVAMFRYLDTQFRGPFTLARAPGLFFLGAAVVAGSGLPAGPVRLAIATVAAGIGAAYLASPTTELLRSSRGTVLGTASRGGAVELVTIGVVAYFGALLLGFPVDVTRGGVIVNVYLHFVSFSIGFVASYITCRLDRAIVHP